MKIMWIFLVWVGGTISLNLYASDRMTESSIRSLVRQGKILPLEQILQRYQPQLQGRLLDLEVEDEHGMILYEMKFILENGRVIELKVDAANGALIKKEYDD